MVRGQGANRSPLLTIGLCRAMLAMLAVLAFNLVGDALRDLLDPRLRGE
jgi:ABC-type dipeptide/oligopeptide/nickel transport system permease subunit